MDWERKKHLAGLLNRRNCQEAVEVAVAEIEDDYQAWDMFFTGFPMFPEYIKLLEQHKDFFSYERMMEISRNVDVRTGMRVSAVATYIYSDK